MVGACRSAVSSSLFLGDLETWSYVHSSHAFVLKQINVIFAQSLVIFDRPTCSIVGRVCSLLWDDRSFQQQDVRCEDDSTKQSV